MNESQRKGLIIAVVAVIVIVLGLAGISYLQQQGTGEQDTVTEEQKDTDSGTSDGEDGNAVGDSGDSKDAEGSGEDGADASPAGAAQTDPLAGFTRQDQTVWTTARVNFREGPGTDSGVIAVIGSRQQLASSAFSEEWYYVTYGEKSGFVSASYISKEEPPAPETTTPAAALPSVTRPAGSVGRVVVIDPGHQRSGDSSPEPIGPGASTTKARVAAGTRGTTTGVPEYELTLAVGLQLRTELLNRGYTVYMTRESHDVNISNMERAQYAGSVGADIAVRLHGNGVDNSGVSGALALAPSASNPYISSLSGESQRLSQCVLNAYCSATGLKNRGVSGNDSMTGINWSSVPVTILEMGFMTNPSDDRNMQDAAFQQRMVQGIADGIDDYFGL